MMKIFLLIKKNKGFNVIIKSSSFIYLYKYKI